LTPLNQTSKFPLAKLAALSDIYSIWTISTNINIEIPNIVQEAKIPNRPGRPRKNVDLNFLHDAADPTRNIIRSKLAADLKISTRTLNNRLKEAGITWEYSNISDAELDALIKEYRDSKPQLGFSYITAHIRSLGHRVQDARIRASVHRTGGIGTYIRHPKRVKRRQYHVARPDALWHLDGHHKLILWGIVIHGVVDGYCRTVRHYFLTQKAS
jgi:hypothetical protein